MYPTLYCNLLMQLTACTHLVSSGCQLPKVVVVVVVVIFVVGVWRGGWGTRGGEKG